jgi:hypothetical protein
MRTAAHAKIGKGAGCRNPLCAAGFFDEPVPRWAPQQAHPAARRTTDRSKKPAIVPLFREQN